MLLSKINSELLFTINKYGVLVKITDQTDSNEWLSRIYKTEEILNDANEKKRVILLYRGENKNYFYKKTGTPLDGWEHPRYDRLFVIGSKAKSYLRDKDKSYQEINQFDRESKIKYIYNMLSSYSKSISSDNELTKFTNSEYFLKFKQKLLSITNRDEQISIENFYLAFIHTISSDPNVFKAHSVLLSSTRDRKISAKFAKGGYEIAFWLTNPIQNQAIDYKQINSYNSILSKYNLPTINIVHFPDESEVTVFSAIFPHNIFFVHDFAEGSYIINPYLIDTKVNRIVEYGINVDQSNFSELLRDIYSKSIWRNDDHLIYERDEN